MSNVSKAFRRSATLLLALSGVLMLPAISPAAADPKAAAPMAAASNAFGADLYGQLASKAGNVFFSPVSISSALTMTQRGARDKTADEMASVLHLPAAHVNEASQALLSQLAGDKAKNGYQLSIANALWLQTGAPFNADYLTLTKDSFQAGLQELNFATGAEAARGTINDWVAKQTNDKIKDLLPSGSVNADTRLVLTNAVYFKGDWDHPFKKNQTADADFTGLDGKATKASMMHVQDHFQYGANINGAAVLELPYAGNDLAMVVVLPNKNDAASLGDVEKKFSDTLTQLNHLQSPTVMVTLPKWKMTQKYDLTGTLQSMGMKLAFAHGDFSGINGRSDLQISAVVHQAYIDVNEEGTEAAGATGVVMRASAVMAEPKPVAFVADHPFVYAIVHRATNTVLFMGRIDDPSK